MDDFDLSTYEGRCAWIEKCERDVRDQREAYEASMRKHEQEMLALKIEAWKIVFDAHVEVSRRFHQEYFGPKMTIAM